MSEIFYIGFSTPVGDEKAIDRLVRKITAALPLGVTLNKSNRARLLRDPQPSIIGEVADNGLIAEDFDEVFRVICASIDKDIGVKLVVGLIGQEGTPRVEIIRKPRVVRAKPAPKRVASDLLYGPRRV